MMLVIIIIINPRKPSCPTHRLHQVVSVPWRAMLTSAPVWACVIIASGSSFGFQTLLSEMPTYLANIQHFDMNSVSILYCLGLLKSNNY